MSNNGSQFHTHYQSFPGIPFKIVRADIHKKAVACVALCFIYPAQKGIVYLKTIDTHPNYRNKGHALEVLKYLQKTPIKINLEEKTLIGEKIRIIEMQVDKIVTSWEDSTDEGRKLCLKAGFKKNNTLLEWKR